MPISVIYAEKAKRNPFAHGMQVLTNIIKLVGQHRPLMFFGTQGLLLLVGALFTLLLSISTYLNVGAVPFGTVLLTGVLTILGLVAWAVGLVLHSVHSGLADLRQTMQRDHERIMAEATQRRLTALSDAVHPGSLRF